MSTEPRSLKRLVRLHPRVGIERIKVVNTGFMGWSKPQIQWGWGVTLDGERHGKPVMQLHDARKEAEKLSAGISKPNRQAEGRGSDATTNTLNQ
jgi:hypothetical protein